MLKVTGSVNIVSHSANLQVTAILDFEHEEVQRAVRAMSQPGQTGRSFLRKAHLALSETILPVYSVDEWQPASKTLQEKRASCSQRMACLEAIARAASIPTRVRVLFVRGSFWYPRFRFSRWFIPKRILLLWPQFLLEQAWVDFDELHGAPAQLAAAAHRGFRNDGESLFEAVRNMPVDFLGKTCGLACAKPEHDLSRFVLKDAGFFDIRDDVFRKFGSFQHTLRGRLFELVFDGRKSS